MAWGLVAVAGAGLAGALIGANASQSAADTQAAAAGHAADVQAAANTQNQQNIKPWLNAGQGALNQIQQQMPYFNQTFTNADFREDPGYQFRLQQGQLAIERAASARGGSNSGATLKALTNYNSGLASQEYQSAYDRFNNDRTTQYNRLASLAGLGQTAATSAAASNNNAAANVGNYLTQGANAQAAGTVGTANAFTGGLNTLANTGLAYNYMNSSPSTSSSYANPAAGFTGSSYFSGNYGD